MDIDIIDLMDLEVIENLLSRTLRKGNKSRMRRNPFTELSDEDFKLKYRFTKRFGNRIVDIIKAEVPHDSRGDTVLPEMQVACALRSWVSHENQNETAALHGVSQPVVSKICKNVAEVLSKISHRYIKMPSSIQRQEETMQKFHSIAHFPSVIGAIDCTHIKIKKLTDVGKVVTNEKGYSSINVQVVSDADLKITDIVAGWCSSVQDSQIFAECRLKRRFEAGRYSGVLLGDNNYPCTPYLFTPLYNNHLTPQDERYNIAHNSTRNVIKSCLSLWKQQFRCLVKGMYGNMDTVKNTIIACAVLHNIALGMGEDYFSYEDTINQTESVRNGTYDLQDTIEGTARRRQFIESHF